MKQKKWFNLEERASFNAHKDLLLATRKKLFGEVPDSELVMLTVQFPKQECLTFADAKSKIKHLLNWIPFIAIVEEPNFNQIPMSAMDGFWSLHLHVLILKKHIPKSSYSLIEIVESEIYDWDKLCGYLSKQNQIWKEGPIVNFPKRFLAKKTNQISLDFEINVSEFQNKN